jgi:hypothetical protein
VDLSLLLPSGRTVAHFDAGSRDAGNHSSSWTGDVRSGIYLVSLKVDGEESMRKVVVP